MRLPGMTTSTEDITHEVREPTSEMPYQGAPS